MLDGNNKYARRPEGIKRKLEHDERHSLSMDSSIKRTATLSLKARNTIVGSLHSQP